MPNAWSETLYARTVGSEPTYYGDERSARANELLRLIGRAHLGKISAEDELAAFEELAGLLAQAIHDGNVGVLDACCWELRRHAAWAEDERETHSPERALRCRTLLAVAESAFTAEVARRRKLADAGEPPALMSEEELRRVKEAVERFRELPEWFTGTAIQSLVEQIEPLIRHIAELQELLGVRLEQKR